MDKSTLPDVKALLFDVYGTLATWYPDRYVLHSRAAARFGIEVTKEGIDAGYAAAEAFMTHQNTEAPIRLMSPQERDRFFAEFEQIVLRGCGIEVDLELAQRIWAAVAAQEYKLALYEDVLSNFALLRERGYNVGIVSNVPNTSKVLTQELGLDGNIDFAVTSSEAGSEKPDRRIFLEALRRAGDIAPSDAMMIGDQIESDILGAEAAGITPILLDRNNVHPHFTRHHRITSLVELHKLLS